MSQSIKEIEMNIKYALLTGRPLKLEDQMSLITTTIINIQKFIKKSIFCLE